MTAGSGAEEGAGSMVSSCCLVSCASSGMLVKRELGIECCWRMKAVLRAVVHQARLTVDERSRRECDS